MNTITTDYSNIVTICSLQHRDVLMIVNSAQGCDDYVPMRTFLRQKCHVFNDLGGGPLRRFI